MPLYAAEYWIDVRIPTISREHIQGDYHPIEGD